MKMFARPLLVPRTLLLCMVAAYFVTFVFDIGVRYFILHSFALILRSLVLKESPFQRIYEVILVVGAFFLGAARIGMLHPAINAAYRNWLVTTPWHARLPLPLGPLYLVWQDVFFILVPVSLLACFHLHLTVPEPLIAFFLGYLIVTIYSLAITKPQASILIQLVGLPGVLLLVPNYWLVCLALSFLTVSAGLSLSASLTRFPWETTPKPLNHEGLGFPFNRIGPVKPPDPLAAWHVLGYSFLSAWPVYCFVHCLCDNDITVDENVVVFLAMYAGGIITLVRVVRYMASYHFPLSLFGRIATGHLIMPRYDVVLIGPIVSIVLSFTLPNAFKAMGTPVPLECGLTLFFLLLATLGIGPSLRVWRLTGGHRISPPQVRPSAQKVERRGQWQLNFTKQ